MSNPRYTEQQAAAVFTREVSIALSAGAGCGKTFVLTQRFLQQLEPASDAAELSTLVAITFTDRAAREMRDRVREACQSRLQSCAPEHVDHWLTVLRGLDTARISTIHSFCTSLLRSNAIEAALDPRFAVLEPPLAAAMLEAATESVLHARLIAEDAAATAFVLRFGLERTQSVIANLAQQRFRVDWQRFDSTSPADIATLWQQTWQTEFVPRLIRELRAGAVAQRIRKLLTDERPEHPEMLRRCGDLLFHLDPERTWHDPTQTLADLLEVAKVQGGGTKKHWSSEDVYDVVKDTLTDFRKEIQDLQKLLAYTPEHVALAAEFSVHAWELAQDAATAYETQKLQAGALDFDDLLLKARDLLRDRTDVRQRVMRSIQMLMVDEFQDTDPVQADIVRFLCGEQLPSGKLFLVGDIKQSIYRFRRADPGVFRALRQELPETGQMSLTRNFRSQPEILKFVNLLFGDEFEQYEPLEPFADQQLSPTPSIEFLFADHDVDAVESETGGKPTAQQLRQREADWIARRIAELLADHTPRVRQRNRETGQTELRRVQPGDITILFRALSDVQEYEAALRRYGLDYYLVGGKAFFAQQEVFDLLNLCRVLDCPDDVVALIGVLRSPLFGLSDDALQALRPATGDWWHRLREPPPDFLPELQRERILFAGRTLHELRQIKDRLSIADLLNAVLTRTGYDAAMLAEFLGNRKVANLRKLIDQAATFDRSDQFTLKDYIERLQTSVIDEIDEAFATTLPESGDVIRLMSIHQSKGLEFPIVVVADINRKPQPAGASQYLHPDWGALVKLPDQFGRSFEHLGLQMLKIAEKAAEAEETQRLFYVAVTRAADHLILSAAIEPGGRFESPWMRLLGSRFDLQTGLPKTDPLLGTMVGAADRHAIPEINVQRGAPQAQPVTSQRTSRPLSQFWQTLWDAEPEPLPESLQAFSHDATALTTWSVSKLEEIDARLQPAQPRGQATTGGSALSLADAEQLGNLVHAAVEHFDHRQPESWPAAVECALRMQATAPDARLVSLTRELLERYAASELTQRCGRARQLFREVDFSLPWPPAAEAARDVVIGQIDMCGEMEDGAWEIYDFKTLDAQSKLSDDALLQPYRFQLGVYALALESWLQRPVARLSLVLLRPHFREVRLAWDDALRAEVASRLTSSLASAREAVSVATS